MRSLLIGVVFVFTTSHLVMGADSVMSAYASLKEADAAMSRKQNDKALSLAKRALATLESHPQKPEGVSDAEWARRQNTAIASGHWIAGVVEAERNDYYGANKDLRAALPLIKDKPTMLGPALFHLGVANYQLGRETHDRGQIMEGAKFSEQCAAITGPFQRQAYQNAQTMKAEATGRR